MMRVGCNSLWLVFSFCLVLQSCTKAVFEDEESSEKVYTIQTQVYLNNIWDTSTRGETDESTDTRPFFMCYLFDEAGTFYINRGKALKETGNMVTFKDANTPGTYTIYGITGLTLNECPRKSSNVEFTKQTPINIPSPKDICVGNTEITVHGYQFIYDTTVQVDHIMAKVTFQLNNIPSSVISVNVILPNQANQFTLEGDVIGDAQMQTLTLHQNTQDENPPTYDWSSDETIVYPFASDTEPMPIQVQVTTNLDSYTFNTESETRCNKGMFVTYTADWNTMFYSMNTGVVINPWSESVEGGFNFGHPTVSDEN